MGAIVYLAIFGGIVGYSCYALALSRLPLAIVSIYTYINPVVAVFLCWWVYRERFGLREAGAMAVIFAGVAMVRRATSLPAQKLRADRATETPLAAYRKAVQQSHARPGGAPQSVDDLA